jgi:hypothetical protein
VAPSPEPRNNNRGSTTESVKELVPRGGLDIVVVAMDLEDDLRIGVVKEEEEDDDMLVVVNSGGDDGRPERDDNDMMILGLPFSAVVLRLRRGS